jgi:hypothetical protein
MKVRFNGNIFVRGQDFKAGEVYVIDDDLAEWLQGFYEIVEEDKAIEEPPKDKMVKSTKKKGE